jgi:ABC-type transport system involved in cytochrome c biogenesis permease subunit
MAMNDSEVKLESLSAGFIPAKVSPRGQSLQGLLGLWPVVAPILLAALFILARIYARKPIGFLYSDALIMLALISYIGGAVLLVTNLFVKEKVLDRLGLLTVAAGYCFNLSGWMMRWIEAGDKEGWKDGINGVWRYYPLDNLYALTLGFCAGAGLTTLVMIRKPKYRVLGALSMPILVVILALGMMLGSGINTLMPILDSYWRPIHVSIATLAYGVCLVSFGLAFAFLVKDGIRYEIVGIVVALYGLLVYGVVGHSSVILHGDYTMNMYAIMGAESVSTPFRTEVPWVGPLMILTLLAILAALAMFVKDYFRGDEATKKWGWRFFRGAVVLQAIVLALLFFQIKNVNDPGRYVPAREYPVFSQWVSQMGGKAPDVQNIPVVLQQNASLFKMSANNNPVEVGGLIGLFVALLMVALFSWKRKEVRDSLPPLKTIDGLLYRTVGVAFPLLSLLLITGAVWANESWGRYWGWDSKEVGALVAWMAYAGFLHTRIAHGWQGRRSAYFALLGFALVIFTWLGVSFIIPGLHSYAQVSP